MNLGRLTRVLIDFARRAGRLGVHQTQDFVMFFESLSYVYFLLNLVCCMNALFLWMGLVALLYILIKSSLFTTKTKKEI